MITVDANQAVADVAYRASEVIAIYPITPASTMGEHADAWATKGRANVWGTVPSVSELQSEGGAAGAIHGALMTGSLATTFTASQGLLLMIPNMYKIAGELLPCVIHVAARTLATHALSIFCDHGDVYAARGTGFAMLAASSVQEAQDFALIAHAATLASRVPFLHFFDGFRTSHEVAKIAPIADETVRAMIDEELVAAHRARALSPDHPTVRGTAHNPDTFFQAREAANLYHDAVADHVEAAMQRFGELTGRRHALVAYHGHPEAERVVVVMGSAAVTARQTVTHLAARGERVGAVTVSLFRPFPLRKLVKALPATVRRIAVLDRNKEPGAGGEALYLDVLAALHEPAPGEVPCVVGGRYGLSSKELTPAMIAAVLGELRKDRPKNHFTVGIRDDVTHTSIDYDESFQLEPRGSTRALFWGLGSDGTVSATKSSVEILGAEPEIHAQGYFVYDSKKSGGVTVSHLRFGPEPIEAPYLVARASFVACHQWSLLWRFDVLEHAERGAIVLLNAPYPADRVWDELPREVQEQVCERSLRLFAIDAYDLAYRLGSGRHINLVMQSCFFALSGVLPRDKAIACIEKAARERYGKLGAEAQERNAAAITAAIGHLAEVSPRSGATAARRRRPMVAAGAPDFVQRVTALMMARQGDRLPVSAFPPDGTWPTGTSRWEERAIALEVPVWDEELCIQCNKCALICPHAAIRAKIYPEAALGDAAPDGFVWTPFKSKDLASMAYSIGVAPDDCTGCELCVEVCPAHAKDAPDRRALAMRPVEEVRDAQRERWAFFRELPEIDRKLVKLDVKHTQLLTPLLEFSGACAGCGETPYIKLLTQLFGDRLLIANATGCSSIFGGNLPTTPYCADANGRGPAWANSLFEDNAEFGLGMRLALDQHAADARRLLARLEPRLEPELCRLLREAEQLDAADIDAQRGRVAALQDALRAIPGEDAARLAQLAEHLVEKCVWIVGGDGWAYDIGFGGLDHVLATGANVKVLVLDTEVYSNTGGQQSKATPLGASAKFAAAGKARPKKDLALHAMSYGNVYVAQIALGADDRQALRALLEAQAYDGPAIVIAYSHCIAHGYDLSEALTHQHLAVDSAYWPLLRFDPRREAAGKPALQLDSKPPKIHVEDFAYRETRFRQLRDKDPERARELMAAAERAVTSRYHRYQQLAGTAK